MKTNSVKVEIITIGDEILIGQIIDTNSAWMAVELNKAGFELAQITSIHDDATHIADSLDLALQRADIVLFTGGIGPTKDDITKQTLCGYFGMTLRYSEEVYQNIERVLIHLSRAVNELTKTQAFVPDGCTVIQNTVGTAPITWFEKDGKVIVSMPGVPHEMKNIMSAEIIPRLSKRFETPSIIHKNVIVRGYPESALAIKIADWENALPEDIHLAYLPNYRIIKLRLSGISDDPLSMEFSINQQIAGLTEILGDAIVAFDDLPVENIIGNLLAAKGMTLATAESCTGGHVATKITSVPGCSDYFKGSVVAYSNEVKINVLNVASDDIEQYGAVSKEVVEQMAVNIRRLLKTDFSIAISGIAGPSGGSYEKPVGTVWISVSSKDNLLTRMFRFNGLREQNIERATQEALLMLKEII